MDTGQSKRPDNILIFDESERDLKDTGEVLTRNFPDALLTVVSSLSEYRKVVGTSDFDLVVLSHELSDESGAHLIQELKLKDYDPAVLVVSRASNPKSVSEAYASGCNKCIVKNGPWREELAPAVRHLLRFKKLEEENRKLLAKLTEANILLEEKNKRLDDFSATLAHDIRGPLGGISMKLEYILDTCEEKLDQKFAELLKRAFYSTERLTAIVQGMYDFARLGAKAAKMSEVKLGNLVEEVIGDLHFAENLDIKIGIGELPQVWGNPHLLQRVFINLINNAVKYNDKKDIIVNIGCRKIVEKSIAEFAEIFVEDNGPGIPHEETKDIFAMFSRGSSAKKNDDGVGVGLAVVQRIVELHYGKISVESEVGQGSRFVMLLPLQKIDFIN